MHETTYVMQAERCLDKVKLDQNTLKLPTFGSLSIDIFGRRKSTRSGFFCSLWQWFRLNVWVIRLYQGKDTNEHNEFGSVKIF